MKVGTMATASLTLKQSQDQYTAMVGVCTCDNTCAPLVCESVALKMQNCQQAISLRFTTKISFVKNLRNSNMPIKLVNLPFKVKQRQTRLKNLQDLAPRDSVLSWIQQLVG